MILFAPEYDEPTRCTFQVARLFLGIATETLLRDEATRSNLHGLLAVSDSPVVAFGHGAMRHLPGQNSEAVLTARDARTLSQKAVLAFACHTGTEFGGIMSRNGNVWWGYTGLITAPPEEATESGLIEPVFALLVDGFLMMRDRVPPEGFFVRLQEVCEEAANGFDELHVAGYDVDVGTYHCLLHVWDRLRVWSAGSAAPAHHPRLQSDIFILG
jgi:hypothetical protein